MIPEELINRKAEKLYWDLFGGVAHNYLFINGSHDRVVEVLKKSLKEFYQEGLQNDR